MKIEKKYGNGLIDFIGLENSKNISIGPIKSYDPFFLSEFDHKYDPSLRRKIDDLLKGNSNSDKNVKNDGLTGEQKSKSKKRFLKLIRDKAGKMTQKESDNPNFNSDRNLSHYDFTGFFGDGWKGEREMQEVPLYLSDEIVTNSIFTEDYESLSDELKDVFNNGLLRTFGSKPSEYSVLMSVTSRNGNHIPEGRTGTLLHKGNPVIVEIDGKDYVIEMKGVGSPDGKNDRLELMLRSDYFGQGEEQIGGFDLEECKKEFENLELLRQTQVVKEGNGVRALAKKDYSIEVENKLGEKKRRNLSLLLRLAPSNIRSSYSTNSAINDDEDRDTRLPVDIGKQYAQLAKLDDHLLHHTIHPENIVNTGEGYTLTDFADCSKLRDLENPYHFLKQVIEKIREVPGLTQEGIDRFYSTISQELGVDFDVTKGYEGFIDSIWGKYFANLVYENWKGKKERKNMSREGVKSIVSSSRKYGKSDEIPHYVIAGIRNDLLDEENLLKYVNTPEAIKSLEIARKRIDYLTKQLDDPRDINEKYGENPYFLANYLMLPYMYEKGGIK